METETVNKFLEYIKNYHQDCFMSQCGWVLDKTMPYIGKIRDLLYCGKTCIVIKFPYSINYAEPNEQNLDYLYIDWDTVKLKQNHKYFTQCFMEMGVTKTKWLLCGLDYI